MSATTVCSHINKHPDYNAMSDVWRKMRDCQSEKAVKGRDDVDPLVKHYLPKTTGQRKDTTNGETAYQNKKTRAKFPSNLIETERAMGGLLAKNNISVKVPKQLEDLIKTITDNGESLSALNARINEQQLIVSRCGLLIDMPLDGGEPYVVIYSAERILNWDTIIKDNDEKPTLVILDVSGYQINKKDGKWEWTNRCKILGIDDRGYYTYETEDNIDDIDLSKAPKNVIRPMISGRFANEIPFVVCNATNTLFSVEDPCLESLADDSLHYYRNSANYEELLFMQTIAIFYRLGFSEKEAKVIVSTTSGVSGTNENAKVGFAEVSGAGIEESRLGLENIAKEMLNKGIALMEAGANESGEALSIRLTTKTAKLTTIANTSTQAIEKILKIIARWMNISDKEIEIKSGDDFTDNSLSVEDLVKLAGQIGFGTYTLEDYYNDLKENGRTRFDSFEDWKRNTEQSANMNI